MGAKALPREPKALAAELLSRGHIARAGRKSFVSYCRGECRQPSQNRQLNFYSGPVGRQIYTCFECVRKHFPDQADQVLAKFIAQENAGGSINFSPTPDPGYDIFQAAMPPAFNNFLERLETITERFCDGVDRLEKVISRAEEVLK